MRSNEADPYWHEGSARIVTMLRRLMQNGECASIKALADDCNISSTTCYRIVRTLEQLGWVLVSHEQTVAISPQFFGDISPFHHWSQLAMLASPHIQQLADQTQLACKLSIWYVDRAITLILHGCSNKTMQRKQTSYNRHIAGSTMPCICAGHSDQDIEVMLSRSGCKQDIRSRFFQRVQDTRQQNWNSCTQDFQIHSIATRLQTEINDHPIIITLFSHEDQFPHPSTLVEPLLHTAEHLNASLATIPTHQNQASQNEASQN